MRVLLIDNVTTGHHISYAKALGDTNEYTSIYFFPNQCKELDEKKIIIMKNQPNSFINYIMWIKEILCVAKLEKIDIIHFLYGDILYKFWGIGLEILSKYRVIATFHQVRRSFLRDLSRKLILKKN